MAGKHKGWHQRWRVDVTQRLAEHDTGLIVYFDGGAGREPFCPGGGVAADNLATVTASLAAKNGPHNTPQMLKRLAREAEDVWAWAIARQ